MKKTMIIALIALAGLSLVGCTTVRQVGETAAEAVTDVQDQHTPAEWAAFWQVLATVSDKGSELAITRTGAQAFTGLATTARDRAEYWEARR